MNAISPGSHLSLAVSLRSAVRLWKPSILSTALSLPKRATDKHNTRLPALLFLIKSTKAGRTKPKKAQVYIWQASEKARKLRGVNSVNLSFKSQQQAVLEVVPYRLQERSQEPTSTHHLQAYQSFLKPTAGKRKPLYYDPSRQQPYPKKNTQRGGPPTWGKKLSTLPRKVYYVQL